MADQCQTMWLAGLHGFLDQELISVADQCQTMWLAGLRSCLTRIQSLWRIVVGSWCKRLGRYAAVCTKASPLQLPGQERRFYKCH